MAGLTGSTAICLASTTMMMTMMTTMMMTNTMTMTQMMTHRLFWTINGQAHGSWAWRILTIIVASIKILFATTRCLEGQKKGRGGRGQKRVKKSVPGGVKNEKEKACLEE